MTSLEVDMMIVFCVESSKDNKDYNLYCERLESKKGKINKRIKTKFLGLYDGNHKVTHFGEIKGTITAEAFRDFQKNGGDINKKKEWGIIDNDAIETIKKAINNATFYTFETANDRIYIVKEWYPLDSVKTDKLIQNKKLIKLKNHIPKINDATLIENIANLIRNKTFK